MDKAIREAIRDLKEGGFNCMPLPDFRDPAYKFSSETVSAVEEAGCYLKWLDTFKGGCWHVIPN